MRQRKIKNVEEKIENYGHMIIDDPKEMKGKWNQVFGNDKPIYLEIGCGKGQFIVNNAISYPDRNFIAVEGHMSVCYRALAKAAGDEKFQWEAPEDQQQDEAKFMACDGALENIRFIREYIDEITDYFEDDELAGIYLNFSDPWPKKKHAKRRLTYGKKLKGYERVIENGGRLQFKTDNDGLFEYSVEQIEECGLKVEAITRDLHNSEFLEGNIETEYEYKFSIRGKNINYVLCKIQK